MRKSAPTALWAGDRPLSACMSKVQYFRRLNEHPFGSSFWRLPVNQYQAYGEESRYMLTAAEAAPSERATFLKNVYVHLFGAVLACVALTAIFMETPAIRNAIFQILTIRFGGLIMMVGFMVVMWVASSWAHNAPSTGVQYAGLGLSVTAHAVLFTLLLTIAEARFPGISQTAALVTLAIFAGLTAIVWYTAINFNFLGPVLW